MNEYQKFKHLLEYFVAHLEFCVTDNTNNRGYEQYIKNISNFKKSGQGHKGQNIQTQVHDWEQYDNGNICININATSYQGLGCYLNWEDTAININATWHNNIISNLKITKQNLKYDKDIDTYKIVSTEDILTVQTDILGLFNNEEPNDALISFFDTYNSLIRDWNQNQSNQKNMQKIQTYTTLLKEVHNIILTGAPGTGKTYLAKQIAKQIIGVTTEEELEQSGQFAFVQFHPSYDYTDFVEGLRPTKPDANGNIGFELKDGIFKAFCKKASLVNISNQVDNFDEVWDNLLLLIRNNMANGSLTKIGSWEYGLSKNDSLKYSSINTPSQYTFTITKPNVYNAYQNIKARPSGAFQRDMEDVVEYMKKNLGLKDYEKGIISEKIDSLSYVFIIDEINRAEISKVFGELFFSIDPGYRGKKGAVKTQYYNLHDDENELFFIPENVYIIGTMNDIDRSVESFDFAMRRRFTWEEITAEQSAENMNLPDEVKDKMKNLNDAIYKDENDKIEGLNASFHIGGAYFLDKEGQPRTDYGDIWKYRIEPLLKEYLRGMPDADEKLKILKEAYGN